jgi:hypothetical protein
MCKRLKTAFTILTIPLTSIPLSHAQAPAQKPKFETISIKPNNTLSGSQSVDFGPYFKATNVPIRFLIWQSYLLFEAQPVGGAEWLNSGRFDIQARAESGTNPHGLEVMPLVQSLLEDRFQLKFHREMREFTAIQEQLGLKLDAVKAQTEVMVIDSIQKPSEN